MKRDDPPPQRVKNTGVVNATGDTAQNLQDFELPDLQQFTREGVYSNNASKDFHLFYVGRDDVHDILKYVLSRASVSLYINMFGYDDDELNQILMAKALDRSVTMLITLDQSQAGGVHEKTLIAADQKYNLAAYNTHFVVGQSATHQISHTKGFVADGRVGAEGSTNWSASGEGTFANGTWHVTGPATPAGPVTDGGAGYKAQNNTQSVFTDQDTVNRFQTELVAEHVVAQKQAAAGPAKAGTSQVATPKTATPKKKVATPAKKAPSRKTSTARK